MNRTRSSLLPFALMLVASATARGQDIDDFVRGWIEKQHVPAVAIAVIKDGVPVKVEGNGSPMWRTASPPGPTPFSRSAR